MKSRFNRENFCLASLFAFILLIILVAMPRFSHADTAQVSQMIVDIQLVRAQNNKDEVGRAPVLDSIAKIALDDQAAVLDKLEDVLQEFGYDQTKFIILTVDKKLAQTLHKGDLYAAIAETGFVPKVLALNHPLDIGVAENELRVIFILSVPLAGTDGGAL